MTAFGINGDKFNNKYTVNTTTTESTSAASSKEDAKIAEAKNAVDYEFSDKPVITTVSYEPQPPRYSRPCNNNGNENSNDSSGNNGNKSNGSDGGDDCNGGGNTLPEVVITGKYGSGNSLNLNLGSSGSSGSGGSGFSFGGTSVTYSFGSGSSITAGRIDVGSSTDNYRKIFGNDHNPLGPDIPGSGTGVNVIIKF